ncbi:MAG: 23S rRNA (adenine(2030)-N(6))-methyltransferase RlmJ [Burkholderiaceae bacterium]
MLAYRHAFHAGNHADVLKHTLLALVLRYMNAKPKAYRLIDTHAGAGGYSLQGEHARKKREFETGIARLVERDDLPPALADYVGLVRQFNAGARLEQYPGSPAIARLLLRRGDQHRLFEMHPTEHRILAAYLADAQDVEVYDRDGFEGLKSQLPPSTRRAVVLLDPSYEGRGDYGRVHAAAREAISRFAEGVYLIWYPQVGKLEAAQLPKRLIALAPKGWLHASLTVQQSHEPGFGLNGSGVVVINPPHTLHEQLKLVLPFLTSCLGQYAGAHHHLEHRAA